MAGSFTRSLMEMGAWEVELDYRADIAAELMDENHRPRKVHVRFFDPTGTLRFTGVALRAGGDEYGLKVGGRGMAWWLDGDVIEERDYVSGNNKLSEPQFALGGLYWDLAEHTTWSIHPFFPPSAFIQAGTTGTSEADDILRSAESFPTEPGWAYEAQALVGLFGQLGLGHFRLRTVYTGRFINPNLFPAIASGIAWDVGSPVTNNPQATTPSFEIATDPVLGTPCVKAQTPFPIYQLVRNPVFSDDYDYWFFTDPHWLADGSAAPDLPTSIHYEGSGFITPDVVITNGSDVLTSATADWTLPTYTTPDAAGSLVEGPGIPPYTFVVGVSGPGTLQISAPATEDHLAGDTAVAFRPQTLSRTWFTTCAANDSTTTSQYPVSKGETWSLYCHVMKTDNANGSATINFAKVKTATDDHLAGVFWEQAGSVSTGGSTVLSTAPEPNVRVITKSTTIEEETTALGVFVELQGNSDGRWWFSNFLLQRVMGNVDSIPGQTVLMTGERTYHFALPVYSTDLLVDEAVARLVVVLTGPDRPDKVVTSSDQKRTDGKRVVLTLDVTPPSGYTAGTSHLEIQDVFNDSFYFGEMTVTDTDTSTQVVDLIVRPADFAGYAGIISPSVAPDGAESVHVAAVAESQSGQWIVARMVLRRTDIGPHTGNDIIADLLTDPETGAPLSVTAGTVDCPDVIPYDWTIRNLTDLELLRHYRDVVSEPPREWRLNPDRTLDVGADIFVDHGPDSDTPIVLLVHDRDVEDMPSIETDVEDRHTDIKVIGADRHRTSGGPDIPITATADVPGTPETDWNGRTIRRTKIVTNAAVDHRGYAQALADDLAVAEAEPALSVTVKLSGVNTRPDFDEGDWIYLFNHKAGLISPDYPQMIDGVKVFPRRVRVLSAATTCGPGWRIEVRRVNGTTFNLPFKSSDEDATVLTVGDRLPEWAADPQGKAEGVQYVADRKSRPR